MCRIITLSLYDLEFIYVRLGFLLHRISCCSVAGLNIIVLFTPPIELGILFNKGVILQDI